MNIHGYSQLTLLDYPGKLACTIFTANCNFRCPFCHNASLVTKPSSQPALDENKILEHLASRRTKLEGVCITGGEPTLNTDLPDFLSKLKNMGFLVKLDTNGSNPDMLGYLLSEGLLDCVAMDIKASPSNYTAATGLKDICMDKIFRSTELLMTGSISYEFRTTVVDGIHSDQDFEQIRAWLKGAKAYYLQQYKDSGDLIAPVGLSAPSAETLNRYRDIVLPFIPNTQIRGVDN